MSLIMDNHDEFSDFFEDPACFISFASNRRQLTVASTYVSSSLELSSSSHSNSKQSFLGHLCLLLSLLYSVRH